MTDKQYAIIFIIALVTITIGIVAYKALSNVENSAMAAAGLQQCLESDGSYTKIVWRKECK